MECCDRPKRSLIVRPCVHVYRQSVNADIELLSADRVWNIPRVLPSYNERPTLSIAQRSEDNHVLNSKNQDTNTRIHMSCIGQAQPRRQLKVPGTGGREGMRGGIKLCPL